jgi:hypothetical protein
MKAKVIHEQFYQEFCALLKKHTGDMPALEQLAVTANLLGKMIAMQDQRTVTPERAMEIVARNIELGNSQVIEQLAGPTDGTA